MNKIFQAEIAESLILGSETLDSIEDFGYFKIGGKLLFKDLSALKYVNNLLMLEKMLPTSIHSSEYKEFSIPKEQRSAEKYFNCLASVSNGKYISTALIIKPTPQSSAEDDIDLIYVFQNGESVIKSLSHFDNSYYNKSFTDSLLLNYGIDSTLLQRKLENDYEIKNKLKIKQKFKL